jgi:HlyD family secretion protein
MKKKTKIAEKPEIITRPKFYQKKTNIVIGVILLGLIVWGVYAMNQETPQNIRSETVQRTDLVQEISVTGSVKPSEKVSLGFEVSGKVNGIYAQVGDRVEVGQKLISLKSDDLSAQLRQAQAGLSSASALLSQYQAGVDTQQAKLDELKKGTRPEEIRIVETGVLNAEKNLEDAEKNLENVKNKADVDLENALSAARNALLVAVEAGKSALITLSDEQWGNFQGDSQEAYYLENTKATAVLDLLGGKNAGSWVAYSVAKAEGGVYGEVQNLTSESSDGEIETVLIKAITALQKTKTALNAFPLSIDDTGTTAANLETEKISINDSINTLTGHQQTISLQKVTSSNLISAAETEVNKAQNSLATAQDQLSLKQAGATAEQIRAQEAQLNQAKANLASQRAQVNQAYASVQNYQAQLDKTVLYAPIGGLVTKMEAKIGEIVFPSSPYSDSRTTFVSIISDQNFEIEANVAEVDIAKISIGDPSRVTLDAYGDDVPFEATVTAIDPAETLIEGIPTYKVTLQFNNETQLIKSGMTANLDIVTDKQEGVISIPQRAIISRDGKKFVRIIKESDESMTGTTEKSIEETEVQTGITGLDGRIVITEGLDEGDQIVISID